MDGATPIAIRLRRSIPEHEAYTVRLADHRFAVLATARPSDARRWVATTRWLHHPLLFHGRLLVGLGVQWTPTRRPLGGAPPVPATLQLCVGHRCLVFHLAQADAVPESLRRFLADPRVTFVGSGYASDRRMLWAHYGIHVACGRELRAVAGMGNASMEEMADRILGYPGVSKPRDVAMSAWHAPRLDMDQVLYAALDAFLAFRLGLHLCPGGAAAHNQNQAPPAHVRPLVLNSPLPPDPRIIHLAPPVPRAPVYVPLRQAPPVPAVGIIKHAAMPRLECSPRAFCEVPILAPAEVGSYTDAETDYDGDAGTRDGLPVRAYASDSEDDDDYSSDGFEHVGFGAFTDDEEDDQVDENTVCTGMGTLSVRDQEYAEIGILTVDGNIDHEFTGDGVVAVNVDDEQDGAGNAFEYLGHSEAVLGDGEDALGQDDWNDQEGYGCADLDDDDALDDFYLL